MTNCRVFRFKKTYLQAVQSSGAPEAFKEKRDFNRSSFQNRMDFVPLVESNSDKKVEIFNLISCIYGSTVAQKFCTVHLPSTNPRRSETVSIIVL